MILLLSFIATFPLILDCYRFENNYVEVWYRIPVSLLFSPNELESAEENTVLKKYSYRFDIYDKMMNDSAYIEGIKGAHITSDQQNSYFIDYLPVYLYPGNFCYRFLIESDGYKAFHEGEVEIPSDTAVLTCSDVILGTKVREEQFMCHGYAFTPSVALKFTNQDTLFSYVEIYGLQPDSLHYDVKYHLIDSLGNIVYGVEEKRLKYAYVQIDTHIVTLNNFIDGEYAFFVEISDSALNTAISSRRVFNIKSLFDETTQMKYYYDIQYLVPAREYKKFCSFNEHEKKVYLKKFWSEKDYWQFEKRLFEADDEFSTRSLKGRNSERGKYYIKYGPPESREITAMLEWGRQLELWYYYGKGQEVLFCDIKNDGNPQLIVILKPGELVNILEFGYRDPERDRKWPWLFDIAPGTYQGQKSLEEKKSDPIRDERGGN